MAYYNGMYGGQGLYTNNQIQPQLNNLYQNYNTQAPAGNFGGKTIIYATEDEIKAYILQPNSQIYAFDKEKPILRVKSADGIGRTTLDTYNLVKVDENINKSVSNDYLTKEEAKSFVTKEEFNKLVQQQNDIEKLLRVGLKNEETNSWRFKRTKG